MQQNEKGHLVFAREKLQKGEIICTYDGEVCTYKELHKRNTCCLGKGVIFYSLNFKKNGGG